MEKIEDMEIRNNHKNQKTVKTDKTASAIFSESLKSLKSLMPFFANNEKKGSRVKEGEAQTNLQLISFLSPTTVSKSSRKWAHIAAMLAMLLIIGVGDAWGASTLGPTSITISSGWTNKSGTSYCGGYGKNTNWYVSDYNITALKNVLSNGQYSNFSLTIRVKAVCNTAASGYSNSLSVVLLNSTGGVVGNAQTTTSVTTGSSSSNANWNIFTFSPTSAVTGYKIYGGYACAVYTTEYTLTYDEVAVAAPTFSVAEGTYTTSKSVTLSCGTAGATIRYTTDGTDPTGSSTAYSSAITVDASKTIKAKAFKAGLTASDVASATYTIKCATPTFSVAGGTKNNDVDVTLSTTFGTSIYYTTDGTTPTTNSTLYSSAITVNATQTIKAIAVKSGCSDSDVASATYTMVCVNPTITLTGGTYYNDQSTTISTTTAGATIRYTLDGTTPTESSAVYSSAIAITSSKTLKAKVFKSGYTASSMVSAAYTLKCEQPSLSAETNTYIGSQDITITCGTTDAVIRYTLDGSDPTESSTIYTSAITFSTTKTLKARAFKSGYTKSDQKSGTYTIKCAVPTASPAAGTHSGPQDVELSTTYGDKIYYTLTEDGTTPGTPSESSTEYDGPIHMTVVTKIKAIAWKDGCSNSNQLSGTFTIQYNVTWMVDGSEWSDKGGSTTVNGGGHISTLPTAPTTGEFCGDRFMGWTDAEGGAYVHGSSELYTTASEFPNATGDQVFYAVFADYAE